VPLVASIVAALLPAGLVAIAGCGPARRVSSDEQLYQAVREAVPGEEIVIAAGTYRLRRPLRMSVPRVTLRGATGNRDDVVLWGGGMNDRRACREAVMIEADDITVRDLTIMGFRKHGLHIRAETDADRALISNVKTVNIGERHVKGSRGRRGFTSDDVVIERLYMLQTERRQARPGHPISPEDYIGGIDVMATRNWIIRDCVARGIRGATGGGNAAIFMWNGVDNVLIERNRIIDCCKGIALGNPSGPYRDAHHAVGGIIRNNFILRSNDTDLNNIGLELCNVKDVRVYHNTIYSENAAYVRSVHLYDERGEALTTNVELAYNIIRGQIRDNTVRGGWRLVGNLHGWKGRGEESPDPGAGDVGPQEPSSLGAAAAGDEAWRGTPVEAEWFVDPAKGDLHLTPLAAPAIDKARPLPAVPDDVDGSSRPNGKAPDVGADEYDPAPHSAH